MQLGETIATYDIALALRGESGKFDVTSPTGEIFHLSCKSGHSITNLEWSGDGANHQPFLIRKVAEPVSSAPEKALATVTDPPTQPSVPKTPFLISSDDDDLPLEKNVVLPGARHEHDLVSANDEICDLELFYVDLDPKTQRPSARVSLRKESAYDPGKLTNACGNFNDFDAEIRRLHARLDDIRYRARKKFYQAQEIAAGA